MSFLRLEVVVRQDRHVALQAVSDSVSQVGGWIMDHSMFSDVMAVLTFVVPADRTGDLVRRLSDAGIAVEPAPVETSGAPGQEIRGQITMLFAKGTGDLRRDVPAFQ